MTILQALAARYDRLAERGEASVPGFGPVNIGFAAVLDTDGRVVTVDDMRVGDGKRARPQVREAPRHQRHGRDPARRRPPRGGVD